MHIHTLTHVYTCRHRGGLLTVSTSESAVFIQLRKSTQFGLAPLPPPPLTALLSSLLSVSFCALIDFALFSRSRYQCIYFFSPFQVWSENHPRPLILFSSFLAYYFNPLPISFCFSSSFSLSLFPFFVSLSMAPQRSRSASNSGTKPRLFQCTGYGDCHMVFTRSEHLARHAR